MLLLTGSTGFIGSHFLKKVSKNYAVRVLLRPLAKTTPPHPCEIFHGDLLSEQDLKKALLGIDTVVHLAALLRKNKSSEIMEINVEGTRLLAKTAKENGVKQFIYLSSENAMREDLSDAYAVSKRNSETIVKQYFPNALIFRPCFVYGPKDGHGLGRFIQLARRSPLVPLFGGLKSKIQPVYIDDMTDYLLCGIDRKISGTYTIAGPETVSINDFIKRACNAADLRPFFISIPRTIYHLAAILSQTFLPSSGWGMPQFKNIYASRNYDIRNTVETTGIYPRDIETGLKSWFSDTGK